MSDELDTSMSNQETSTDTRSADMLRNPPRTLEQPVESPSLVELARSSGMLKARPRRKQTPRNPTGKGGFKDNPQNINRKGRQMPKSQRELRDLIQAIAAEPVEGPNGEEVERLVDLIRRMFMAKSPVDHLELFNRGFGRQPTKVDMTSGGQKLGWNAFIAMTVTPSLPSGNADADATVDADVDVNALPAGADDADEERER